MHIAIENAGAERGALVLETDAGPVVHADDARRRTLGHRGAAWRSSVAQRAGGPRALRAPHRRDAARWRQQEIDEQHGADAYLHAHRPRALDLPAGAQARPHDRRAVPRAPARRRRVHAAAAAHAGACSPRRRRCRSRTRASSRGLRREVVRAPAGAGRGWPSALAEVQRLKDDLEAENTYLRRDLIANVSHDLRTPLVADARLPRGAGQPRRHARRRAARAVPGRGGAPERAPGHADRRAVRARQARLQGRGAGARGLPLRRARCRRGAEVPARGRSARSSAVCRVPRTHLLSSTPI